MQWGKHPCPEDCKDCKPHFEVPLELFAIRIYGEKIEAEVCISGFPLMTIPLARFNPEGISQIGLNKTITTDKGIVADIVLPPYAIPQECFQSVQDRIKQFLDDMDFETLPED